MKKTPIQSLSVSFVARNLCYLLKHTPGTSPEGGYDTTMFSQAIDYAALPYTRTFGLSVSLGFFKLDNAVGNLKNSNIKII